MKLELFRLLLNPPDSLPFSVRSSGHHIFERNVFWGYQATPRDVIQFFWVAKGRGSFQRTQTKYRLDSGMVAYYLPGETHIITPLLHSSLDLYWFTIDGPLASALIKSYHYPEQPTYAGNCPAWLFERLFQHIADVTPNGLHECATVAFEILSMARAGMNTPKSHPSMVNRCLQLIRKEFTSPELNVNAMAEILRVNRSVLSRNFRQMMNITIIDYLSLTRIHYARTLLMSRKLTIKEIAHRAGFTSASYFIERFYKHYGQSPTAWLQNQGIDKQLASN